MIGRDDDWRKDAAEELAALQDELHERWRNGDDPVADGVSTEQPTKDVDE